MTALTPRRPLTAETELRGLLGDGRMNRAQIDALLQRLYAERDGEQVAQTETERAMLRYALECAHEMVLSCTGFDADEVAAVERMQKRMEADRA